MSEKTRQPTVPAPPVGEKLRQYRERGDLSLQQIATQLHLETRVIEALEADDYDNLPAPIYVRGYIRGYAKLVNADADELIKLYDANGGTEAPEIIPEVKHSSQTNSSDKPVKAFTYLLTLLLVVLLITWWQSNFLVPKTPGPKTSANERAAVPPAFDYPYKIVKHPDSPFYRAEEAPAAETTNAPATDTGETAPLSAEATEPAAAGPGPEPVEHTIVPETTGPDTISLKISADSWIEIYDADGAKVMVSLARAGDTFDLHGTAPFSVLLGFAQGVNIQLNGKPFDPAPYSRSGVARFTLGE